jgi:hypothetical protein
MLQRVPALLEVRDCKVELGRVHPLDAGYSGARLHLRNSIRPVTFVGFPDLLRFRLLISAAAVVF